MTKTAHTPTPWILKIDGDEDFTTRTIEIEGRPKGLSEVAIVTTGSFTDEVEEANAEFIVRACNSHDGLKEDNRRLTIGYNRLESINAELVAALKKATQYAIAWQVKDIQPLLGENLDADIESFQSALSKSSKATS